MNGKPPCRLPSILTEYYSFDGYVKSRRRTAPEKFKIKARDIPCPEAYLSYAARTTGSAQRRYWISYGDVSIDSIL